MRKVKDNEMDTTMEAQPNLKFSNFSIDALISPRNLSSLSPFLSLSPWLFPMSHGLGNLSSHSAFSPYAGLTTPHFPLSAHHTTEGSYSHNHSSSTNAAALAAAAAAASIGPASSDSSSGGSNIPVPTIPEDLTLSRLGSSSSLFSKSFSVQDYIAKTNQFLSSAVSASMNPLHHAHHHLEGRHESGASSGELSPSLSGPVTTRIPKTSLSDNDTNSPSSGESINGKHSAAISHHLHQHLSPLDSSNSILTASHAHPHPLFAHHFHNNYPASATGIPIGVPSPPGSSQSHHGVPDSPPNTPGTSPSGKCHSYTTESPLPLSGKEILHAS